MPKLATIHLQKALKGEMEESDTRALLGETPSRWKYVYFSEPDLILHTVSESANQHVPSL